MAFVMEGGAGAPRIPHAFPVHPAPESCHTRARLGFEFCAGKNVAVNCPVAPGATFAGPLTVSPKLLVIWMVATTCFERSAAERAVSVTVAGEGRICGATKFPALSTVPHAPPLHPVPEIVYKTPGSGLPTDEISAEKLAAAPSSTAAGQDRKWTVMSLVIATGALLLFVGSAALVAVTVTVAAAGRIRGAVYTPAALTVPTTL